MVITRSAGGCTGGASCGAEHEHRFQLFPASSSCFQQLPAVSSTLPAVAQLLPHRSRASPGG
eukprot:4278949-Alexandrium_andersonii.AAC.1